MEVQDANAARAARAGHILAAEPISAKEETDGDPVIEKEVKKDPLAKEQGTSFAQV